MTRRKVIVSSANCNKQVEEKYDAEGYDHYIAIDWSMNVMAIAHLTPRTTTPRIFESSSNLKVLQAYLRSLKGRSILTIEETTSSQWLFTELFEYVTRVVICDPYWNKLLCHGPKTDTIDAAKLCLLLYNGLLHEVYHSTSALYELRSIVSAYLDLVGAGVRLQNQRSALQRGHHTESPTSLFIMERLEREIELYRVTKDEYEDQFEKLIRQNRTLRNLVTVPGIGTINAVKILACVIDARRFSSKGKYYSYCGLVKHEKLSGGRSYGFRKPRYNHILKAVYKTAALVVLGGDNPISEYFQGLLSQGVAEHNARHAVSRYIARVTLGIIKSGEAYDPDRWKNDDINNQHS
jgi:hypothetical protein